MTWPAALTVLGCVAAGVVLIVTGNGGWIVAPIVIVFALLLA